VGSVGDRGGGRVGRLAQDRERTLEQARVEIVGRLRARRRQIERAIFERVSGAGFGHAGEHDAEYVAGLRAAVAAAVELSLLALQHQEPPRQIPAVAIEQARRAARMGINLDTVLRRYIAGQALLADFIMEEVSRSSFSGDEASLHHQLRETQTPLLEQFTAGVIEAYTTEVDRVGRSPQQRRVELVQALLGGAWIGEVDAGELDYPLDGWHIGMIATGCAGPEFVRSVTAALGCEHLVVERGKRARWVWFGRRRKFTVADIKRLSIERPLKLSLASGEPRKGLDGWRLTHQEAQAAQMVALRRPSGLTRCSDVLLEAAVMQNEALADSLIETFLVPLDGVGYRGRAARDTLLAYFESKRNVSSTANRLGVARNTVESRLREIEERLGRQLHMCSAQLEVALRLEALSDPAGLEKPTSLEKKWSEHSEKGVGRGQTEQSAQPPTTILSTLAIHSSATG
jgi:hypothetical protein